MSPHFRRWLPEYILGMIALFFFWRELGLFPRAWIDEGLFIMVARSVLSGKGYAIELLDHVWRYPYFLAIGPTIVWPTALSMKIFGISIAAARVPMVLYMIGTSVAFYYFTRRTLGLTTARVATALLITLSTFVNTGKPVLGEVPAFFFLMVGLCAMVSIQEPIKRGVVSGLLFGLSFLTKLTFGLLLPALGIAWLIALGRKQWQEVLSLTIAGVLTALVYLPWRIIESMHTPLGSLSSEISESLFGSGDLPLFYVLRDNIGLLTRLPLIAFGIFLLLGTVGLLKSQRKIGQSVTAVCLSLIILFTLYFLNSYGWYRHLLPAHLLLLPFVPLGAERLMGKQLAVGFLILVLLAQTVWQFDHRGSGIGTGLATAVSIIEQNYGSEPLLIEESEVFAQLPSKPHWLYLIRDRVSPTMPEEFRTPTEAQRCYRHVRTLNVEEIKSYGEKALQLGGSYFLIPPSDCPATTAR